MVRTETPYLTASRPAIPLGSIRRPRFVASRRAIRIWAFISETCCGDNFTLGMVVPFKIGEAFGLVLVGGEQAAGSLAGALHLGRDDSLPVGGLAQFDVLRGNLLVPLGNHVVEVVQGYLLIGDLPLQIADGDARLLSARSAGRFHHVRAYSPK